VIAPIKTHLTPDALPVGVYACDIDGQILRVMGLGIVRVRNGCVRRSLVCVNPAAKRDPASTGLPAVPTVVEPLGAR
jgi:hypothetical protein